jgi:single-strand DNA-binding protein
MSRIIICGQPQKVAHETEGIEMGNSVELIGRLGKVSGERDLPSGDHITAFSVIVDRPEREIVGRTKVDAIPCQTFRVSVASKVNTWESGTEVVATGVLRRRFWRTSTGLGSVVEVEVRSLKRA